MARVFPSKKAGAIPGTNKAHHLPKILAMRTYLGSKMRASKREDFHAGSTDQCARRRYFDNSGGSSPMNNTPNSVRYMPCHIMHHGAHSGYAALFEAMGLSQARSEAWVRVAKWLQVVSMVDASAGHPAGRVGGRTWRYSVGFPREWPPLSFHL